MAASRRSIEAAKVPGAPLRPLLRCPAATEIMFWNLAHLLRVIELSIDLGNLTC